MRYVRGETMERLRRHGLDGRDTVTMPDSEILALSGVSAEDLEWIRSGFGPYEPKGVLRGAE